MLTFSICKNKITRSQALPSLALPDSTLRVKGARMLWVAHVLPEISLRRWGSHQSSGDRWMQGTISKGMNRLLSSVISCGKPSSEQNRTYWARPFSLMRDLIALLESCLPVLRFLTRRTYGCSQGDRHLDPLGHDSRAKS